MALFNNDASEFLDKIKNIDKSGIVDLTREVEELTKKVEDYEDKFIHAFHEGATLTKRQKDAYDSIVDSIMGATKAQQALADATNATWQATKNASNPQEKKALTEKMDLYKQLAEKVKEYSWIANNAQESGGKVYNDKALKRNQKELENYRSRIARQKANVDVGNEQPKGEIIPKAQVQAQAESLAEAVKTTFGEIKESVGQPVNAINLTDAIKQAREELQQLEAEKKKYNKFNPVTHNYDLDPEYVKRLEEAKAKLKELEDIRNNWSSINSGVATSEPLKAEEEQAKKTAEQYEKLNASRTAQNPEAFRLGEAMGEADTSWITQEKMSLEELKETYKSLLEEKKSIESQKSVSNMSDSELKDYAQVLASINRISEMIYGAKSDDKAPTKSEAPKEQEFNSLAELKQAIAETKGELDSLREKAKNDELIDFDKSVEEARTLEAELKRLEGMRVALEGKQSAQPEAQKQMNLLDLLKETISTKAQLAKEKTALPFSSDMEGAQANIKALSSRMKELNSIWGSMKGSAVGQAFSTIASLAKSAGSAIASGLVNGFNHAVSGAKQLASSIMSLASGAFSALKSAVSTTLGNMQRLVSGGFNAVKNGVSALKSGFNSVKSTMQSLVKKGTPNLIKSLTSLKSMLMRRIKRTFISSIFNQAKEGLQQLAKSSKDFNTAMSSIKNTTKQVTGNMSVMLANLLQTVAPVLQTILSWINAVLEAINGLFALLSGKKTMMVAKKGTDDYAKSLKGAGGAAKDLNHQLYGFDEITRQEDQSGGGGGGGKISYEEADISERLGGLNDFFKEMLDAFKKGEFEKVGQLIGAQLNNVVSKIDNFVRDLRPKAKEWSENIARILNGLIDGGFDFRNLGVLIGDTINLVFDSVNTFLTKFDFRKLGEKFAEKIQGIFDTVDWSLVGETVANWFNRLPRYFAGLFSRLQWGSMGEKLSISIQSMFNNIDWEAKTESVTKGVNGIIKLLNTIITKVEWSKFTTDLWNHLNTTINNIEWGNIASLVSNGIKTLLDAFETLIDSNFFSNLITKLGETFGKVLSEIPWGQLASDIVLGLAELRSAFWGFINQLDLPSLASDLAGAINGLLTDGNVQKAWEDSREEAKKGLNNIITAFKNLVSPETGIDFANLGKKIGEGVSDLLKDVDWVTLGESIGLGVAGLVESFGELLIGLDLPNVATKIADGINALFDPQKGGATFDKAIEVVTNGINSLIEGFKNLINPQTGINFSEIASTLAEKVNNLIHNTDISGLLETIIGFKADLWDALFKAVSEVDWESIGQKLADAVNGLFTTERLQSLGTNIGNALKSVLEGITTLIKDIDWGKIGAGIVEFIKSIKWADVLTAIVDCLISAVSGVGDLLVGFWQAIFGGGSENVKIPQVLSDDMMRQLKDQMGEAGKQLANELTASIAENLQGAGSNYDDARMLFINSMALLGQGGQEEFESTMREWNISDSTTATLVKNINSVFEALEVPNATLESVQAKFHENGIYITNGLAESLIGKGKENIGRAMQLLAKGVDEDTIAALDLTHLNENITRFMNENKASLDETIAALLVASGEDLKTVADNLGVDTGKILAMKLPEGMVQGIGEGEVSVKEAAEKFKEAGKLTTQQQEEVGTAGKTAGKKGTSEFESATEEGKTGVVQKTEDVTSAVQQKYEALPDEVKPYAEKLMEYIVTALSDQNGTVKAAIEAVAQGAVDRAKELLNGDVGLEIAKAFIDGMRNGIQTGSSGNDSIAKSARIVAENAINNANAILSYKNAYAIGKNVIVGLYNGFYSNAQNFIDLVVRVCKLAIEATREVFKWGSPSKVFENIGSYVMEGMQIGIEDTGKDVVSTVSDIAEAITDAGDDISLKDKIGDNLDSVANKLERIVDIFADMADVITSMGGLEIPAVANGQSLPYRTRVDTQGAVNGNGISSDTDLERMLYNAFTRALGSSDNEQTINVTLQVDGRKMADIVSKYQRQQSRAWGV